MKNIYDKMLMRSCNALCNQYTMCRVYPWSEDFCYKETNQVIKEIKKYLYEENKFDINKCTIECLQAIGFNAWDDKGNLLIPLWATLILDENLEVTCIDGEKYKLKDVNNDVRCGCIAYMITIKENKNG